MVEDNVTEQPSQQVDLAPLKRLVEIDRLKAQMEADLKKLATERKDIAERIKTMFEQLGTDSFRIEKRTVYLHRQYWAKAKIDNEEQKDEAVLYACEALKLYPETAGFVKEGFNTQSLSAFFRQRRQAYEDAEEAGLQPEPILWGALVDAIDFSEVIDIRSRNT